MEQQVTHTVLNDLKDDVNKLLGFHEDTPRINYGPCGVFAKLFFDAWNKRFDEKVHICFIMTMDFEECDHVLIRLPWGELYDGGIGIHNESTYSNKFLIDDMLEYDRDKLEKWSYGLDRIYPQFCPNYNKQEVFVLINKHLNKLQATINSFKKLRKTIINARGQSGEKWCNNLEHTIKALEKHWCLNHIQPVVNMSWNYVAFAEQKNHSVVLKIGADARTIDDEYHALQHFAGVGMINLIDYYPKLHALLLERATPGSLLKDDHPQDVIAVIAIYANVVKKLKRPTKTKHTFQHVSEWCNIIDEINDKRIPDTYIQKAKDIRKWLFDTVKEEYVCHGDLHLENIIKHGKQWVAIDPKGIIGEMAFEAAAFDLLNQEEKNAKHVVQIIKKRIEQLANTLNLNEKRLIAWIFLRVMLSIQWFIEDKGDPTNMLKMADHIYPLTVNLLFDDIKPQLEACLDRLKSLFNDDLLGVYLYGSALTGGLQKYSDIDVFVIINRATTPLEKKKLVSHILQVSGIYMKSSKRPIEMTIVEKTKITPWQYPPRFDFQYGEWLRTSFVEGNITPWSTDEMPELAIIVTQVLLKSQTLFGLEPQSLVSPVPYQDFIKAMLQDLNRLNEALFDDTRNVLLTYARIWSTLETNTIRSKPAAADWVIHHLSKEYVPVMHRAKSICIGVENESWDDIKLLLKPCADFMLSKINESAALINFDAPQQFIKLADE